MPRYRARIQYVYMQTRERVFTFDLPYAVSRSELFSEARECAPVDDSADDIDVLSVEIDTGEIDRQ